MLENTLIGLIVKNAIETPDDVAMREKRYGIWRPMTWREFQSNVQRLALGMRALGFKDGDNLAPGFRISGLGQLIEAGIQADRLVQFGD